MASSIELPDIIGLPPESYISTNLLRNSVPIIDITPAKLSSSGMTNFNLVPDWSEYETLLNSHGFTFKKPIKIAYVADSFPTFSLQNEYGDSFIDRISDIASSITGEVAQMVGGTTVTKAINEITSRLKATGGMPATIGEGIQSGLQELSKIQENFVGGTGSLGKFFETAGKIMNALSAGQRVDFPTIWKGSNWSPNYSFTIKLYNPIPGSIEMTKKYITGPLTALILLAAPRSENGKTFAWPFFHKIKCKGIFVLDPGVITSLTIVEGGDQLQIGYNQRLQSVDVRIDITSTYRSMIGTNPKKINITGRPTVKQFIDNLNDEKELYNIQGSMITESGRFFMNREKMTQPEQEHPVLRTRSLENINNEQSVEPVESTQRISPEEKAKLKSLVWA